MTKIYRVEDLVSGECRSLTLDEAEALLVVDAHEIEWAIEEYGICETDDYAVTEYPDEATVHLAA